MEFRRRSTQGKEEEKVHCQSPIGVFVYSVIPSNFQEKPQFESNSLSSYYTFLTKTFRSEYWYCSGEENEEVEEVVAAVATDEDMSRNLSNLSNSLSTETTCCMKDVSICTTLVVFGAETKASAKEEGVIALLTMIVASVKAAILLERNEFVL